MATARVDTPDRMSKTDLEVCCAEFARCFRRGTDSEGYGSLMSIGVNKDEIWMAGKAISYCPFCGADVKLDIEHMSTLDVNWEAHHRMIRNADLPKAFSDVMVREFEEDGVTTLGDLKEWYDGVKSKPKSKSFRRDVLLPVRGALFKNNLM